RNIFCQVKHTQPPLRPFIKRWTPPSVLMQQKKKMEIAHLGVVWPEIWPTKVFRKQSGKFQLKISSKKSSFVSFAVPPLDVTCIRKCSSSPSWIL
ncbi:hypothetical protein CEXT_621421, partial [Caerostris extrusa]